ncbi:threonine synthase [Thermoflexibacter ruber]|uniref:Threonine synthase n=1 Tax=Thermoflexibacter ruber TaxID=1003 RepID=A0A1I2GFW8_9BACT|nr:threonine synthase [Thermoflexibacter ruber]SFF15880.1 L-threonine synthase [Thermoflexibacter ruber]
MKFYSTKQQTPPVSLREAVLKGLPADNGLFMPEYIPALPHDFFKNLENLSFQQIAYRVAANLLGEDVPAQDLERIVYEAINFPAPLVSLSENVHILELFHGNTLAFKDFGARFMAQLMGYFVRDDKNTLEILVATSGDTGSAVAHGFLNVPGINVTVLYPKGKVSNFQEKQFTTLGNNITALEIDGTFDDCQALVKQAFLDKELTEKLRLSSANSINIARLIPQAFYYFEAYKQIKNKQKPTVFVVPSGNFGNLTAGLLAKRMGLPISQFVAATNANDIVPYYLSSGTYQPRPSIQTISNAMDVGNPSNFARMADLFEEVDKMRNEIKGYAFSDEQTKQAMSEVKEKYNYIIDPHGAVGYLALKSYMGEFGENINGIVLETAHPVKFAEVVSPQIGEEVAIPERMRYLLEKEKMSIPMSANFEDFKTFLMKK